MEYKDGNIIVGLPESIDVLTVDVKQEYNCGREDYKLIIGGQRVVKAVLRSNVNEKGVWDITYNLPISEKYQS